MYSIVKCDIVLKGMPIKDVYPLSKKTCKLHVFYFTVKPVLYARISYLLSITFDY